jgi:hypothetical protein
MLMTNIAAEPLFAPYCGEDVSAQTLRAAVNVSAQSCGDTPPPQPQPLSRRERLILLRLVLGGDACVEARELAALSFGLFDSAPSLRDVAAAVGSIARVCSVASGADPVESRADHAYALAKGADATVLRAIALREGA